MPKLIPKDTPEDQWLKIPTNRRFAIRCPEDEEVFFRLGGGLGLYLSVSVIKTGRALSMVKYEEGETSLITHLKKDTPLILGRTSDCDVKIMHAIVSRQHARVEMNGNILTVTDVGSTNGTYIFKDQVYFDVDDYLAHKKKGEDGSPTLGWIHEEFGEELDDYLQKRIEDNS